jgi:hypothetical protein
MNAPPTESADQLQGTVIATPVCSRQEQCRDTGCSERRPLRRNWPCQRLVFRCQPDNDTLDISGTRPVDEPCGTIEECPRRD